jgi:hypothetical protein
MNHQEFIERVLERIKWKLRIKIPLQETDASTSEILIEPSVLIRSFAEKISAKIKPDSVVFLKRAPKSARFEKWLARRKVQDRGPIRIDLNITNGVLDFEFEDSRLERQPHVFSSAHAEGNATNAVGDAGSGLLRIA